MKKLLACAVFTAVLAAVGACGAEAESGIQESRIIELRTDISSKMAADTDSRAEPAADKKEAPDADTVADNQTEMGNRLMKITAGESSFTAALAENSSVEALKELLREGPLTIQMSDYGSMEKTGPIGTSLPRNDEQITTGAGDIILYQGNSLAIYYDTNAWSLTRIGKIEDVTGEELLDAFGSGDVTVTFSLE